MQNNGVKESLNYFEPALLNKLFKKVIRRITVTYPKIGQRRCLKTEWCGCQPTQYLGSKECFDSAQTLTFDPF